VVVLVLLLVLVLMLVLVSLLLLKDLVPLEDASSRDAREGATQTTARRK
jgi:hypothetical protein